MDLHNFNHFEEALKKSPDITKNIKLLAFEGDPNSWYSDRVWRKGQYHIIKGYSERVRSGEKATKAKVILWKSGVSSSLTHNTVYRDKKGLYFNTSSKKYYIQHEPLPDHMK